MVNFPWRRDRTTGTVHYATDGRDVLHNSPSGWEVETPSLWFTDPDGTWGNPIPGAVDGQFAGTLPAVRRCTSLLADTLAGLPWQVIRGWDVLPTPRWLTDPQLKRPDARVAAYPDLWPSRMSGVEFWSRWLTSTVWWGDGYVYVPVRDAAGQPLPPLWQLHPSAVDIDDDTGEYSVDDFPLPAASVIHLRHGVVHDDGHGTGVLTEHGADMGLALTVRDYAANQYRSGIPFGYIKSAQPHMTEDDANKLKASWLRQHGHNGRSIAVLNATTEFTPLAISPLDAALDSARQWSLRDIALAFGIPPYMLSVPGDTSTYANIETRMIEFRTFSLLPIMRRVESVLDSEFPLGQEVKIKAAGLERADTQTRYNAYKVALENGWITVDEVRSLEDLPPMDYATLLDGGPEVAAIDTPAQVPAQGVTP